MCISEVKQILKTIACALLLCFALLTIQEIRGVASDLCLNMQHLVSLMCFRGKIQALVLWYKTHPKSGCTSVSLSTTFYMCFNKTVNVYKDYFSRP